MKAVKSEATSWLVLPVGQTQDEKLQECRLEQKVLVLFGEIREARDLLGPGPYDVHGARQEVVELLDVLCVVSTQLVVRAGVELGYLI